MLAENDPGLGRWPVKRLLIWLAVLAVPLLGYLYRDDITALFQGDVALIDEAPRSFILTDLDDRTYTLAEYRGRVVVLDMWATWCADCLGFLGKVEKLSRKYPPDRVKFLTLNVDPITESRLSVSEVRKFVRENGLTVPVLLADVPTMRAYASTSPGVMELPQTYVLDRNLRVRYKSTAANAAQVQAVIKQLLKQ